MLSALRQRFPAGVAGIVAVLALGFLVAGLALLARPPRGKAAPVGSQAAPADAADPNQATALSPAATGRYETATFALG